MIMNLETIRLRGRPRNRWQDEVREDGRLVGRKGQGIVASAHANGMKEQMNICSVAKYKF
jgi:hypothetical protein